MSDSMTQFPILYVIARNDLDSLNPGKLAAQVAHAATSCGEKYRQALQKDMLQDVDVFYEDWLRQSSTRDFGTTITLQASKDQLKEFDTFADSNYHYFKKVVDDEYPFVTNTEIKDVLLDAGIISSYKEIGKNKFACLREEHTCSYFFGDKDQLFPILGHLKLYK